MKGAVLVAQVIAVVNQKGGVGKTTTTLSIASALHRLGRSVLLVDLDAQASLSVSCGIEPASLNVSVYNVLTGQINILSGNVLHKMKDNLWLLPATIDLSAADMELNAEIGRERLLRDVLDEVQEFDYILIDCPPYLGLLTVNALSAANAVIVPVSVDFLSVRGLGLLIETIDKVRRKINPGLTIYGIVPTMYDGRTRNSQEIMDELKKRYGDLVLDEFMIKKSVRFAEAPILGISAVDYAPDVADNYIKLAERMDVEWLGEDPSPMSSKES